MHPKRCARQGIMNNYKGIEKREREEKESGVAKSDRCGHLPIGVGKSHPAELTERVGWLVETSACTDFMMFFDATARSSRLRQRDGAEMNSRVQFPIRFSDSCYRTDREAQKDIALRQQCL